MPKVRDSVFSNRDFLKLFAGQTASLIGTQVTVFAMPLVAILTLNATVFEVGVVNAARLAPVVVVAPLAGVWLDRTRRRPVLIACAVSSSVLIALVPIGTVAGFLSIGLLCAVAAAVGALNVVFDIGVLSYVPNLVEGRHLLAANGKLQASLAIAGIGGPAIAGALTGLITAPVTLSIDALSYLLVALGLIAVRKPEPPPRAQSAGPGLGRQIAEGFRSVYGSKLLLALLTQSAALNLSYGAFWTIFVVYALRALRLSALELGLVAGAASAGALLGALAANRARTWLGMGRNMAVATIGASVMLLLVLIPSSASFPSMLVLMTGTLMYGVNIANINVNGITLRQVITPKRLLARMNATYRMLLFGAPPAGSALGGLLGAGMGLRPALILSLLAMAAPLLWLLFSPVFRLKEMPVASADEAVGADV